MENDSAAQTGATLFRLLSHEIYNPLSSIITASTYYLEEQDELSDCNKSDLLHHIQTDATQLLTQIENIMSLSLLSTTTLQLIDEEYDAVIAKAIRRMRSKIPTQKITIFSNLHSLVFPMEPALLEQAIMITIKCLHNQISEGTEIVCNAIKTPNHVSFLCQAKQNNMTPSKDSDCTCSSELAICKLIAEAHSGTMYTSKTPDEIIYHIELPFKESNCNV